ncbi:MAG TPA: hypothetical protein VF099_00870, partial [Ktedonobacterales bacterium]
HNKVNWDFLLTADASGPAASMARLPVVAQRSLAEGLAASRWQGTQNACQARQRTRAEPEKMAGATPAIAPGQSMTALAIDWQRQAHLKEAFWQVAPEKARLLMRAGKTLQMGQNWRASQTPIDLENADALPSSLWSCPQRRPVTQARHNSGRQWHLPTALHRNDYKWSRALLTFGPHVSEGAKASPPISSSGTG